jgi:hypothetical protein
MDGIKLANPEAEWDVIARTRKPDYLFMGHLHRPISGIWRGIPFHIQRVLGALGGVRSRDGGSHSRIARTAGLFARDRRRRAGCDPSMLVPLRWTTVLVAGSRRAGMDQPVTLGSISGAGGRMHAAWRNSHASSLRITGRGQWTSAPATKYSVRTDCQNNKKHVAVRGAGCEHTGCYSKSFGQSRQRQSDNSFTQERHCHSRHQRS